MIPVLEYNPIRSEVINTGRFKKICLVLFAGVNFFLPTVVNDTRKVAYFNTAEYATGAFQMASQKKKAPDAHAKHCSVSPNMPQLVGDSVLP